MVRFGTKKCQQKEPVFAMRSGRTKRGKYGLEKGGWPPWARAGLQPLGKAAEAIQLLRIQL